MVEPLVACKGGPLDPVFLSFLDAEVFETPFRNAVSDKKLHIFVVL